MLRAVLDNIGASQQQTQKTQRALLTFRISKRANFTDLPSTIAKLKNYGEKHNDLLLPNLLQANRLRGLTISIRK